MKGIACVVFLSVMLHQALSASWSYHEHGGSAAWPSISGSYCNSTRQSPIDIVTADAVDANLGTFTLDDYTVENSRMSFSNNGHGIVVGLDSDQNLYNLSGGGLPKTFAAHSFHLHWGADNTRGSEHTKNGVQYPAELHMVHYDNKKFTLLFDALESQEHDAAAVLGFFIEVGPHENRAFNSFLGQIGSIINYPEKLEAGNLPSFSLRSIMPFDLSRFWRYNGSLTVPNCQETIIWTVFKETIKISQAQLDLLRTVKGDEKDANNNTLPVVDNYRVVNPMYGRTVLYSSPDNAPPGLQSPTTPKPTGHATTIMPLAALYLFSALLSVIASTML